MNTQNMHLDPSNLSDKVTAMPNKVISIKIPPALARASEDSPVSLHTFLEKVHGISRKEFEELSNTYKSALLICCQSNFDVLRDQTAGLLFDCQHALTAKPGAE